MVGRDRENVEVDPAEVGGLTLAAVLVLPRVAASVRRGVSERRLTRRSRESEAAAEEAEFDDPAFGPDQIRQGVAEILDAAQGRGLQGEGAASERADAKLIQAWTKLHRVDSTDRISNVVVDTVRVLNRDDRSSKTADVRLRAVIRRPGLLQERRRVDERWTLKRSDTRWTLHEYGPHEQLRPALDTPQVASPVFDDQHLRAAAAQEL